MRNNRAESLLELLEEFRSDLTKSQGSPKTLTRHQIARLRKECEHHPEFLEQVRRYEASQGAQKNLFETSDPSFIAAFFSASYFPSLSFEYLFFEPLSVNESIGSAFASNANPVVLGRASKGFDELRVVALFPENWAHSKQGTPEFAKEKVFYFINRFVERFFRTTLPIILHRCDKGTFQALVQATPTAIREACATWVYLHEHFHQTGLLPISKYLSYKNSRPSACLEELRVDLCSMIELGSNPTLKSEHARLALDFILSERLLRYATEYDIKSDYDAIGTQVLFGFMKRHGGVEVKSGRLSLTSAWFECLKLMRDAIGEVEKRASKLSPKEGRALFEDLAKEYGNYKASEKKFEALEFFALSKETLAANRKKEAA